MAEPALSKTDLKKSDKRRRLVAAAGELFREQGFDQTTVPQIASRAQMAAGTVFLYATSKRDLLFMIVNDDLAEMVQTPVAQDAPLLDALLALFRPFFAYFAQDLAIARPVLKELIFFNEGLHAERFAGARDALQARVSRLIADGWSGPRQSAEDAGVCVFALYAQSLRTCLIDDAPDIDGALTALRRRMELILKT